MLEIKTTGVEDYLDGSANIKALIIGGPGAGKTRMASFWPRPIYLDCENSRGSLVDRKMPYVVIKDSKDMLDALAYLKNLERTPKPERKYQTVVVDTADSFQRLVKDEWLRQTGEGTFKGFDAWGYLDTKMGLLFTRLLNLDYNVLVNVHYKDKQFKDGDDQRRELTLQLQGNIGDVIFNDFGLVGWLGTYWKDKEQRRGLTFQPTPDKPFLKDRFHVTPKWLPIEFGDDDYTLLFQAFFDNDRYEDLPDGGVVGQIGDSETEENPDRPVNPPTEGGPVAAKEVPLDKKNKQELIDIGKGLGLTFKGNALKSEMVTAIRDAQAKQEPGAAQEKEPTPPHGEAAAAEGGDSATPTPEPHSQASQPEQGDATPASDGESQRAATADGTAEVNTNTGEIDTSTVQQEATPQDAEANAEKLVADKLGGQVVDEQKQQQPAPPPKKAGPSNCADCGADLTEAWKDPAKRDYIRLSFVKFKRYLCTDKCYPAAVAK